MGLVKDCTHTGLLDNPAADYVGGIAGSGGIASECYAMVDLNGTEFTGGILGQAVEAYQELENPIYGNFYLLMGKDFGAIDGVSYAGIAQGLQMDVFFAQSGSELFDKVNIRFFADGEVVLELTQNTGSSLEELPPVPQKEGYSMARDHLLGHPRPL